MGYGTLLSQGADVDFMIHGIFSYQLFGQTLWITTTHVCALIVMLIIVGFCIAANRMLKGAWRFPECSRTAGGEAGWYGQWRYGKTGSQVQELYWNTVFLYFPE